jgi:hypothetical protein
MRTSPKRFAVSSIALGLIATLAAVAGLAVPSPAASGKTAAKGVQFRNVRSDAEQFIDYFSSIQLTPAQERVKAEALDAIPAPCCKEYTMRTCCCPCNLAKSAWGLSNYLVAKKGYAALEVKRAVTDWLAYINPGGFTGDACFKGGCKRAFAKNSCGGMDATQVIVGDDVR